MDRWDVLIESLFDDWDREIGDQGTLSEIKKKIADAKTEAGSDYYKGDDDTGRAHGTSTSNDPSPGVTPRRIHR